MICNFKPVSRIGFCFAFLLLSACGAEQTSNAISATESVKKVLIFSKTEEFRHQSIEKGIEALSTALVDKGLQVQASEDASLFNDKNLSDFSALVFLNTTGDVLNHQQQVAMERYIQAGGGFVGIHAAADTEWKGDWMWYRRLVGGVFAGHPGIPSNVQTARVKVLDKKHSATQHLPDNFKIVDEWYDFKSLSDRRIDLMTVDENSYQGGGHKGYHPIAWYHEFDGGRSFYTGIGHNADNFTDPLYLQHVLGGIDYVIGNNQRDYAKSRPEPNRFAKEILLTALNEPISLDITQNGKGIIFIERKGQVNWFDVDTGEMSDIGKIPVFSAEGFGEFGLLTVALDPNFDINRHLYMMYNVASPDENAGPLQRISRFTLSAGKVDLTSEVPMIDVPNDDTCCHTGGNMEFDAKGNLYIGLGDNTNPFKSFGVGPTDFRPGQEVNDGLRSSGNTQDLRGKILRITPQADGSYLIPEGNLFDNIKDGKPEIYVMGTRNPYTLAFDNKEQTLYYGDVGPDARTYSDEHGAKGHDEINKVTQAGNFGWPLFIGNNKAYRAFDYATNEAGNWHNPLHPKNLSPLNTGSQDLPAAQEAFIWYPYGHSELFPELGAGGRNALVAGVYRTEQGEQAYPDYYEGALFISDFMRRWVKVVFSDHNGDIYKIEDFAPSAELVAPIDLKFSAQGELYILEYGSKWHTGNNDSSLSRIVYTGDGNRPPKAVMSTSTLQGAAPLNIALLGVESTDPDNDSLTFKWQVTALTQNQKVDQADYTNAEWIQGTKASFTLVENGRYALALTVTDNDGLSNTTSKLVEVGNTPPVINIEVSSLNRFIWPDEPAPSYRVTITDVEDGVITQDSEYFKDVNISYNKVDESTQEQALGHLVSGPLVPGRAASKKHLCIGCHQEQSASVGPDFAKVADKYGERSDAVSYLKQSIAAGGSGRWGQHNMPAHDFLSDDERTTLANYILALKSAPPSLAMQGVLPEVTETGTYQLKATYKDQGAAGLTRIHNQDVVNMLSPQIVASSLVHHEGQANGVRAREAIGLSTVAMYGHNTHLYLGEYDLSEIKSIVLNQLYWWRLHNDVIVEIRVGSASGEVISAGKFDYQGIKQDEKVELTMDVSATNSKEKLYLVTTLPKGESEPLTLHLRTLTFTKT